MPDVLVLKHEWTVGDLIGRGGMGDIYAATSDAYPDAAVKLVWKEEGADRELLFVDLDGVRNIVPILDSGDAGDRWALVMPRATRSLREHLVGFGSSLTLADKIGILTDVATALADLDGKVVHRDLKPENVLLLGDAWCVGDFGISRYAEASTSPDTRKYSKTAQYASPEQWRDEHATAAADVYAFGVMAYELISDARPFAGPRREDFRAQHLHESAPTLSGIPDALSALVEECLYKRSSARPTAANVLARLGRLRSARSSAGAAALQAANRAAVSRRSEAERAASAAKSEEERRDELLGSALMSHARISDALKEAILDNASAARLAGGQRDGSWTIALEEAKIELSEVSRTEPKPWGNWQPPAFTVIAAASLGIRFPTTSRGYSGRSHSLWYCDAQKADNFLWFETAFMTSPLTRSRRMGEPYAEEPGELAAKAVWNGIAECQLAWPFEPLVVGDLDDFISRWLGWLAAASQGALDFPSTMPEKRPEGSFRTS